MTYGGGMPYVIRTPATPGGGGGSGGGAATALANYAYDGHMKRVKSVSGGQTIYNVFSTRTGKISVLDNASTGTGMAILDLGAASVRWSAPGGAEITFHDHLGSPVAATSGAGALLWRESYTPFGDKRLDPLANYNKPSFTGHIDDTATGLTYMQARFYDPLLGRFLQTDPIGYEAGLNLYAYVGNDPVNNVDPDGREVQRRELTLNLGFITISRGSYSASEAGEPLGVPTRPGAPPQNAVETGEYRTWGFILGFSVGIEGGQYFCRDCGPGDVSGNAVGIGGDIVGGLSYSRNESGYRSDPGVGAIREYEGPETFGWSGGASGGAGVTLTETTVLQRSPTQRGLERQAERAIGSGANVRTNQDGSVSVSRPREGSRIQDRTTCRRDNGQTTCN